jgi:hypothetical protein
MIFEFGRYGITGIGIQVVRSEASNIDPWKISVTYISIQFLVHTLPCALSLLPLAPRSSRLFPAALPSPRARGFLGILSLTTHTFQKIGGIPLVPCAACTRWQHTRTPWAVWYKMSWLSSTPKILLHITYDPLLFIYIIVIYTV